MTFNLIRSTRSIALGLFIVGVVVATAGLLKHQDTVHPSPISTELTPQEASKVEPTYYDLVLQGSSTQSGVLLRWSQKPNSARVDYFDVYRKSPGAPGWGERIGRLTILPERSSYTFTDTTMAAKTNYQYYIFGISNLGGYEVKQIVSNSIEMSSR